MALMFFSCFLFFYCRFRLFFSITEKYRCEDKCHKNVKPKFAKPKLDNCESQNANWCQMMRICVKCCEVNLTNAAKQNVGCREEGKLTAVTAEEMSLL